MSAVGQNRVFQTMLYLLPVLIIVSMVFLAKSPIFEANAKQLAPAIILDLILTMPIVFFLIIRKKSIPKTTVVAVLIVGVVIASLIIPIQHQGLLDSFKFWVLPLVELFVISYVFITIRKSVKAFKSQNIGQFDFHSNLKTALGDILPVKLIPFVSAEISAFYYGFIKWKKAVATSNEYSYHKESGTRAILLVVLFLIVIETFVFHLILISWSPIFAWIITGLSVYSAFQIIGILKSIIHRPIVASDSELVLRYGILSEANITYENIDQIKIDKREVEKESGIISFSPLGELEGHNIRIFLKSPIIVTGFYGFNKEAETLAILVDSPEKLVDLIETKIN